MKTLHLPSYLKNKYMDTSIQNKMILLNSFIILFVAVIIGSTSYFLYKKTIANELSIINLRDIRQIGTSIDYIQKDLEELSSFICSDNIVQRTICYPPKKLKENLSDENYVKYMLNNLLVSKNYVSFISIYAENGFNYYAASDRSNNTPNFPAIKRTPFYQKANTHKGAPIWSYLPKENSSYIIDNKNPKITMFRTILKLNDYSTKAFMMISMNLSNIKSIYSETLKADRSTMIFLDPSNHPFFIDSSEKEKNIYIPEILDSFSSSLFEQQEGTEIYPYNGEKYIVTFTSLKNVSWKIVNIVPLTSFTTNSSYVPLLTLLAVILALILGVYFTTFTSSLLTDPIKNLLQSMSRVKDGNLKEVVGFKYKDEIGQLGAAYDQMVSRIHNLIHKVYILEIEEKIAELKALQAQINPHFLYNTLDTIYWKAVAGDNKAVQDMIHALSKVFRLALNVGNEFSLVSQERDFIGYYILLQEKRYKNKLKYSINFQKEIMTYQIPKLILQPFVENAIIHGLETDDKETAITIVGYKDQNKIHFIIKDDGPGISREVLNRLLNPTENHSANPHKGGYGLKNVINRLSLYYDNDYTLDIQSQPGKGTEIHIFLPLIPVLRIRKE